ncbi:MAG TPA: potassium channel protein [Thermoguttaceae bacterium]|nr:potassium channel protein [Thermoguttaceae bacterium]
MTSAWTHLRIGLVILAILFLVGVAGYSLAGWELGEAIYMVVNLFSTVGLKEVRDLSHAPGLRLFTSALIILGVSTAFYIIGAFVQMMTQGEINRALGVQRVNRELRRLSDHIILCGFGRMGEILAEQLLRRKHSLVIVDNDAERVAEAAQLGYLAVNANASEEDALRGVGIEKAKILVTTLPEDADNVFITLTARNLNPNVQIIARGELPSTEKKLLQAGADRVVLPAATGAMRMAAMITRPSMIELVELVGGRHIAEVEIDEITLPDDCPLVGTTLGAADVRSRHGVLIVSVRRSNELLLFAPGADTVFQAQDRVILIGHLSSIETFRRECGL